MIGNQIIQLDRVDSTSNYVATLVSEGKARHGMVILAENQTNGRGQRGTIWQSESAKNLIFSFYLEHKDLEIHQQEALTHFTSIAIQSCLLKLGISSAIKWPNDILVNTKKIAGILIENQLRGTKISSSIIGIGLNVLQTKFDFTGSTSILSVLNKTIHKEEIFERLILELNNTYLLILNKEYSRLKENYLQSLWLLGIESTFEIKNSFFKGIIRGTDAFGRLEIEDVDGVKTYDLKEIKFTLRNEL
jgi:BirA family biotin operon repressor/biotin-[acetyl-CoA-carboxylase] ligase